MIFLAGPRQVGKTTCSRQAETVKQKFCYINWESNEHRKLIIKGDQAVATYLGMDSLKKGKIVVVFDELHKYRHWKRFLKGFFDLYENHCHIIVTGSAKLDIYRKGGDSLMGRYFSYRIHPISVGEILHQTLRSKEILPPKEIKQSQLKLLFEYGGFPEPFLTSSKNFSNNWQRLRKQQILKEDIRELSQIKELAELENLFDILVEEASGQLNIAKLSNCLNIAETTINRWISVFEALYYCFHVKPWSKNIRRSTRKMKKLYLWDWSMINDEGKKFENLIASHLFKSVNYWTDTGLGEYDLFYIRDKEKREVDFLVTRNKKPWFLVEAKLTNHSNLSKNLLYFAKELDIQHAFQVVYDMPYVNEDCFSVKQPVIVPASTFLSQLV